MLSADERRAVEVKALEQAMQQADQARMDPDLLTPDGRSTWPFALTKDDRLFLRIQKISPA